MANTATTPSNGTGSQNQTAKQRSKTDTNSSTLRTTRTNYCLSRQTCHAGTQYTHKTFLYIPVPYLLSPPVFLLLILMKFTSLPPAK